MLAKNVQLIEALQEIKAHEKDTSFLSPQCQFILGNFQIVDSGVALKSIYPLFLSFCCEFP